VTRSTRRWAVSPLDFCVHLLPEDGHLPGGLTARCGRASAAHRGPPARPATTGRAVRGLPADLSCGTAGGLTDASITATPDPGRPPVEL
jgi:hypothetical protein